MLSHGNTPMCQIWYAYVKEQRLSCPYKNSLRKYNFDIEAKGQCHTEVTNVYGDTLSYGYVPDMV